ncbi:MAG TPA: hypothetical protein VFT16_01330 [Candidatus Saccharimonadales bacterium]|nr:hypothetical protein [Candidatus Saccharimonadales bacterium]
MTGDPGSRVLLGAMFIFGGLVGFLLWLWPMAKRRAASAVRPGSMRVKRHRYSYEVGDVLFRLGDGSVFAGMDIHLPGRLPHIYLDSYANDRQGRPDFLLADEDVIFLENDFDRYFRAYAAQRDKKLVKRMLTPEVLRALTGAMYTFDVEIMDDHLRLIVIGAPVSAYPQMQADLQKAAKAILKEIGPRVVRHQGK